MLGIIIGVGIVGGIYYLLYRHITKPHILSTHTSTSVISSDHLITFRKREDTYTISFLIGNAYTSIDMDPHEFKKFKEAFDKFVKEIKE